MVKGGPREGAGRPAGNKSKKPTRDVSRWGQRWFEDEAQLVEETAERLGKKPGDLIRKAALEFCRKAR